MFHFKEFDSIAQSVLDVAFEDGIRGRLSSRSRFVPFPFCIEVSKNEYGIHPQFNFELTNSPEAEADATDATVGEQRVSAHNMSCTVPYNAPQNNNNNEEEEEDRRRPAHSNELPPGCFRCAVIARCCGTPGYPMLHIMTAWKVPSMKI